MCGFITGKFKEDQKELKASFELIKYRGPDHSANLFLQNNVYLGFHRLAIQDLSPQGQQPFQLQSQFLVCNGEIYNHKSIKKSLNHAWTSQSDCEVILPYFQKHGLKKTCDTLDGEYAFVIYDEKKDQFYAARDAMGVRPLFYGTTSTGEYAFSSEAKPLIRFCKDIMAFPPGHYYDGNSIKEFVKVSKVTRFNNHDEKDALKNIRELLIEGVRKRLDSDAPLGFLLSGGLDSSLVCAIATKILNKPITTFAVGIDQNPIDTKYARQVADYIKSDHHEYLFSKKDIFETLNNLIYRLETFDITTIRASMGMSLLCNYVQKETNIKVLLSGEVSDELFGYKYTDFAPNAYEFQKESEKRIDELYIYDILRADRCIASNSLEARVPFSDKAFVEYVMSIPAELKMNHTGVGKHLLRKAFEKDFLPHDILYRQKAAFSDAVGHSMVDELKIYADTQYTQSELLRAQLKYPHAPPKTKEALLYRDIFESHFKGQSHLIKDFWLPNKEWENCNVDDPSARALPNYGLSGT